MKKFSNILAQLKARQVDARKNEEGFSLLELVIAVGILLLLTVGGVVGYNAITTNAQNAAVQSAASEVYTAAVIAEADSNPATDNTSVETEYNDSADGISVVVSGSSAGGDLQVVATHADSGATATKSIA